jgi:hypothetical protein
MQFLTLPRQVVYYLHDKITNFIHLPFEMPSTALLLKNINYGYLLHSFSNIYNIVKKYYNYIDCEKKEQKSKSCLSAILNIFVQIDSKGNSKSPLII